MSTGESKKDSSVDSIFTLCELKTEFAGGRHARRVAKIAQLEQSSNESK